jgi:very-short-patch-repair endonuclease
MHGRFSVLGRQIFEAKYLCPSCANIEKTKAAVSKTRKDRESYINALTDEQKQYDLSNIDYKNSDTKIQVICPKHGDFFPTAGNFLYKETGCPKCNEPISKEHKFIIDLLGDIQFSVNDRTTIDRELDVFIPSKNLAIEVCGLYWHAKYDKSYHLNKVRMCEAKGIKLLTIWDYEINENPDIINSRIKSSLGLNKILHAKSTTVREIDFKEADSFLRRCHIQGNVPAKYNYGLFKNDSLVAVATFNKPRFNTDFDYEIIRYASELDINVVGGCSKILSHFRKQVNPKNIITYADRRFTNSLKNLYSSIGFQFLHETAPSYFYFKGKVRLSRYACQKHKLVDILKEYNENLSENDNMLANGFNKVYDCGNLVYRLDF